MRRFLFLSWARQIPIRLLPTCGRSYPRGMALLEVLVALLVFSIGISGALLAQVAAQRQTLEAERRGRAVWVVQAWAQQRTGCARWGCSSLVAQQAKSGLAQEWARLAPQGTLLESAVSGNGASVARLALRWSGGAGQAPLEMWVFLP